MPEEDSLLNTMRKNYQEVTAAGSGEAYAKLCGTLEKMHTELRDYAQKISLNEMKEVLKKLKNDEPLTDEDMGKLKTWIVGDAKYYIDKEQNFDRWTAELNDIVGKIKDFWAHHPDAERLMKLRSLTYDASKIASSISYYVKQKESVEKFNAATQEIGETERVVLMSLLEQKISTSRF